MKAIAGLLIVIALAGLPAVAQAQGTDDGLVAEWHFDEGSGSVLVDSSGNGNDGVIHGATWVEGKYGKALQFDGVDDYVNVPDSLSLDLTDAITIEAWVKIYSDKDIMIVDKKSYATNPYHASYAMGWLIPGTEYNRKYVERLTIGGSVVAAEYVWSPTLGQLYHLVSTYDGSYMKLYIDGSEVVSRDQTGVITPSNNPVVIGYRRGNNDLYFNGIIDEVCIYNRALTADEIKEHYEGGQTALSLTKSAAPHSIKQGQTTTVTLTIKNTGTTEITDIEVSDTIPSDLTLVDGETSKTYTSLRPKNSREFQYTIQLNEAGTFNLDSATATYSDEEGNYHTTESKTATITVIQSTDQPPTPHTTPKSSAEISTASVHLHGEKTDVVLGEDVLLKLSAVNIIGNPLMHVQVIIIPPSGWSVTSSEFAKSGAGQYTTTYDIKSGVGRDIEVRIVPNQLGNDFQVQGKIVYYFGDDSDAREYHTLTLPITVRAEAEPGVAQTADTPESESKGSSTPGFAAVVALIGLFAIYLRRKRT